MVSLKIDFRIYVSETMEENVGIKHSLNLKKYVSDKNPYRKILCIMMQSLLIAEWDFNAFIFKYKKTTNSTILSNN